MPRSSLPRSRKRSRKRSKRGCAQAKALRAVQCDRVVPDGRDRAKLLEAALATGNVVRTSDGRVYLNERAVADRKEGQGFMALLIILIVASLIASGAALADGRRALTIDGAPRPMAKAHAPGLGRV